MIEHRNSDYIELLGEELIDQNPVLAMEVLGASSRLAIPLGWHYILDLIWLLRELPEGKNLRILEVGGGLGLFQFILADRGHSVISADMRDRELPSRLRSIYRIKEMGFEGKIEHKYLKHHGFNSRPGKSSIRSRLAKLLRGTKSEKKSTNPNLPVVSFYRCNAANMKEIEDRSIDVIVSVSAMEHNAPEVSQQIVAETLRVVKPGGKIMHTTSACKQGQDFHEESHSHLFGHERLAEIFALKNYEHNFDRFEELKEALDQSRYLRKWLAYSYYQSEKNGMPNGLWAPKYMPVGLIKHIRGE